MSYANGTTHYNLPLTVGTDKRDWTDTNQAFNDIDAALHTAYEVSDTAASDISTIKSTIANLQADHITFRSDIDDNAADITTLQTAQTNLSNTVSDNKQDLMDSICSIVEQSATAAYAHAIGEFFWYNDTLYKTTVAIAIGDTIVPNTNCDTTNITTELLSITVPTASDISYDNSTSSLTADNVQSALDEIVEDIKIDTTLYSSIGSVASNIGDYICKKFGSVCTLTFFFNTSTTTTGTWLLITTIANSAFYPAHDIQFSFNDLNGNNFVGLMNTSGSIYFQQTTNVGVFQGSINISWIV